MASGIIINRLLLKKKFKEFPIMLRFTLFLFLIRMQTFKMENSVFSCIHLYEKRWIGLKILIFAIYVQPIFITVADQHYKALKTKKTKDKII